jgi:virginiamycin B lyase
MILGPDGNVWFTESGKVGNITPSGIITEYSAGGENTDITVGPDGNLWYSYSSPGHTTGNGVGKITTTGTVTAYPISLYNSQPSGIAAGSDGNLWFTEKGINKIGKITTAGTITQYSSIPTTNAQPGSITAGSDGALWFTEGTKIGRITTSGTVTEYDVPGGATGNGPSSIVTGPDGAVWFRTGSSGIARMATELTNQSLSFTSTAPTDVTLESPNYTPTASATSGLPVAITVDPSSSSICSIDGSGNVSYQDAGTCTLNADQAGNADYKPAPQVQQSFTVLPVNADVSVALDCPATANVGDTVTCTITATNNGPAASQNTTLTAVFPSLLSGATVAGGATLSGQNIIWTVPSLASGSSAAITLSATTSVLGKARLNAAVLQTSPDPDNSNNFASSTLVIS